MNKEWNGFECMQFIFEEHDSIIVFPEKDERTGYLAVKTEYWDAFPETEIELLNRGFVLCFIRNDNRFGMPEDLDRKARFIRYVQAQFDLASKCVLVGMSCGGMIAINFAARYPELVSCLYLDAPVLNFMSWPCGFGEGNSKWEQAKSEILSSLKLDNLAQVLAYRYMPMDHIPQLVMNRIPVVMVSGDSDQVVPYNENGILLEKAYKDAGVPLEVYIKPGGDHHPHGLARSAPVVEFICRCAGILDK